MTNDKFILSSKTIIASLLALIVQLGPMLGLNFGEDHAALISEGVDTVLTAAFAVLAIWGRYTAASELFVIKGNTFHSPWIVGALGLLLAFNVLSATTAGAAHAPRSAYYVSESHYAVALRHDAAIVVLEARAKEAR